MRLLLLFLLAGCSVSVDVDQYSFVDSVCPRPSAACTGGDTYWFIHVETDIARLDEQDESNPDDDIIAGFDLDRTSEPVCGHADLTSPAGEPGIDNRLAPLFTILETEGNFSDAFRDGFLNGVAITIVELRNVQDFGNDDCVSVSLRPGLVPADFMGEPRDYLDTNADGMLDDDLTMDYRLPIANDDKACIIDGVLQAETGTSVGVLPIDEENSIELTSKAGRYRALISSESLSEGWQGGALEVERLIELLGDDPSVAIIAGILRREADLLPVDGICTHLSLSLTFEAKSVNPGNLR